MKSAEAIGWIEGNKLINELGDERWLGRRVQAERKARGWSQAELSRKMKAAGYAMHQSAISKIEPPDPEQTMGKRRSSERVERRSVTIAEVKGFSKVFGIPFGELLLPPESMLNISAWNEFLAAADVRNEIRNMKADYSNRLGSLRRARRRSKDFAARLREYRAEIMADIERQVRETWENDNDQRQVRGERPKRWNPAEAEEYRPPVVSVIDDALGDHVVEVNL